MAIEYGPAGLDPLPQCEHGKPLLDGGGEILEPPCGCRWNKLIVTLGTLISGRAHLKPRLENRFGVTVLVQRPSKNSKSGLIFSSQRADQRPQIRLITEYVSGWAVAYELGSQDKTLRALA